MIEIIIIKHTKEIHIEATNLDKSYQTTRNIMLVNCNLDGFITRIKATQRGMEKEIIIKRPLIKKVHSKVKREIMMQIKEELFITMIEKIQEKLRPLKIHQKKPKFQL